MGATFILEVNDKLVECIVNEPYSSELELLHFESLRRLKCKKSNNRDLTLIEDAKRARLELATKIVELGEYEVL